MLKFLNSKKLLGSIFIGLTLLPSQSLRAEKLTFVVSKEMNITSMPFADLKKIYLGVRKRWPDGSAVKLGVPTLQSKEMEKVLTYIYKMNLQKYNSFWLEKVFNGEGQAPAILASASDCISMVKQTKGAVCLVNETDLVADVTPIKIDDSPF